MTRLCKAPVAVTQPGDPNHPAVHVVSQGTSQHGKLLPLELDRTGKPDAQCGAWFNMVDSFVRFLNQVAGTFNVNAFHGPTLKDQLVLQGAAGQTHHGGLLKAKFSKITNHPLGAKWMEFMPGGTGCLKRD